MTAADSLTHADLQRAALVVTAAIAAYEQMSLSATAIHDKKQNPASG